jgi:hypothetical protein
MIDSVVCGDIHTLHNNMEITEIKRRRQSYILSIHIIDLPTYILYASHTKHILYTYSSGLHSYCHVYYYYYFYNFTACLRIVIAWRLDIIFKVILWCNMYRFLHYSVCWQENIVLLLHLCCISFVCLVRFDSRSQFVFLHWLNKNISVEKIYIQT